MLPAFVVPSLKHIASPLVTAASANGPVFCPWTKTAIPLPHAPFTPSSSSNGIRCGGSVRQSPDTDMPFRFSVTCPDASMSMSACGPLERAQRHLLFSSSDGRRPSAASFRIGRTILGTENLSAHETAFRDAPTWGNYSSRELHSHHGSSSSASAFAFSLNGANPSVHRPTGSESGVIRPSCVMRQRSRAPSGLTNSTLASKPLRVVSRRGAANGPEPSGTPRFERECTYVA
jgi:hypothetical protein